MRHFPKFLSAGVLLTALISCVYGQDLELVLTSARLPYPAQYLNAVYDGDDSIYLTGGHALANYSALVMKYSLGGIVETVGSFVDRAGADAVMHGGRILIFGGFTHHGRYSSNISAYSTHSNSFVVIGDLFRPSSTHTTVADPSDQLVYIFGGINSDQKMDSIVRYDMVDNSLRVVGRLPEPENYAAGAWDSRRKVAYLFGGLRGDSSWYNDEIRQYEPSGSVSKLDAKLPYLVYLPSALYVDSTDEVFIFSSSRSDPPFPIKFSPATQHVQIVDVIGWPTIFTYFAHAFVPKQNRIYLFGGSGNYGGGSERMMDEIFYIQLEDGATSPPSSTTTTTTTTTTARPPPLDCSDGETRLISDPFCCESFYFCHAGTPNKFHCDDGKQFNPGAGQCDNAEQVGCEIGYKVRAQSLVGQAA